MAKQVGPIFFTGTIDGIIFYKLGDQYYSRSKGSYKSRKQMRKDPKYKRTLEKADQFGGASKLTQEIYYRQLPKAVRKHGLFGKLTGMVNGWLQQGKTREEVQQLLIAHCKSIIESNVIVTSEENNVAVNSPIIQPAVGMPAVKRVSKTPVLRTPPTLVKQVRYLPNWKEKINGRSRVSKQQKVQLE